MNYVQVIDTNIDHEKLSHEVKHLIQSHNLEKYSQISLTSIGGNDDWFCSVGKIKDINHPERYYSTINHSVVGTYIHDLILKYSSFYRWRLMKLTPKTTYTIHPDGDQNHNNFRLHIPVITNPDCFLCFFNQKPESGKDINVRYEHLSVGKSYEVNTTNLHTAVNYSFADRYHIVGVRYENSDNRT